MIVIPQRTRFRYLSWSLAANPGTSAIFPTAALNQANGDTPFSIAAWINIAASHTGTRIIVSKGSGSGAGWWLYIGSDYSLNFQLTGASGSVRVYTSPLPREQWIHVCMTYDGSRDVGGLRLYVQGVPVQFPGANALSGSTDNSNPVRIAWDASGNNARTFRGSTGPVATWAAELSESQVQELLTDRSWLNVGSPNWYPLVDGTFALSGGVYRDAGPNGWDGSISGSVLPTRSPMFPWQLHPMTAPEYSSTWLSFDASSEYVNFGSEQLLTGAPFTICGWMRRTSPNARVLLSTRDVQQPTNTGWALYTGVADIEFRAGASQLIRAGSASVFGVQQAPQFFAVTFDGTDANGLAFFKNGSAISSTVYNNSSSESWTASSDLLMGAQAQNGSPQAATLWGGLLGPIGVWSRVLTPAEILEVYNDRANMDWTQLSSAADLIWYPHVTPLSNPAAADSVVDPVSGIDGSPVDMTTANLINFHTIDLP